MKKNGFVFVETIVAVVVLTSSLLLLYTSFTKVLQSEKTRVNYDDIAYIYRSFYVKNRLQDLNMKGVLNDLANDQNKYYVTIGIEYDKIFNGYENDRTFITNLFQDYEVSQVIVFKENKLDNIKKCTYECSLNTNCEDYENCNGIYTNLSDDFSKYLKSIYIDVSCTYVMAIEYNTCTGNEGNCRKYYSWVSV